MSVDRKQVEHIAALANLKLTGEELARFTGEMNRVLEYMEKLNELALERVAPTFSLIEGEGESYRADSTRPSIPAEEALENAPKQARGQFQVPRIIS